MIYRYFNSLQKWFKNGEPESTQGMLPEGIGLGAYTSEYMHYLEQLPVQGVPLNCNVYRKPLMPQWHIESDWKFFGVREAPDFFSLGPQFFVNERTKKIIQNIDPFPHQFWPVKFTLDGQQSSQQYFRVNFRRVVKIESSTKRNNGIEKPLPIDFSLSQIEKNFYSDLCCDASIRSAVEEFPFWFYSTQDTILYINEMAFNALKAESVTGLKEYSAKDGKMKESVGHG